MWLMFKLLEALKCCEFFVVRETFEIVMRLAAFIL